MVLPVRTVCSGVCCTIELFFLETQKFFTVGLSIQSKLKYLYLLNRLALLISRHWLLMSLLVLRYDTDMDIPLRTKWNNIFEIGKSFWHYIACDIIWVWKSRCVYRIWHTRRNLRFFSPAFRILWVVNINLIFLWFSTKHCCRELLALLQKRVINQLSCCSCKGIKWNKHRIYFFLLRLCPHFCKYFAKRIFSCMFWPLVQTQMTFSVNKNRFFFNRHLKYIS